MLTIFLTGIAIACSLTVVAAEETKSLFTAERVDISRQGDELMVTIDINPRDIKPGRDREVVFTPVIKSDDQTNLIEMEPIRIAGRNRYYSHVRNGRIEEGKPIIESGSKAILKYREAIPWEAWMEDSHIEMLEAIGNCCDPPILHTTTIIADIFDKRQLFRPDFHYVSLTGDSTIVMTAEGSAFIEFPLDKTYLDPKRANNPTELEKILSSIQKVKDDPETEITQITIKGYASPEGSYSHNVELAMGRTHTLKEYVKSQMHFDDEIMRIDFEPEDWEGLQQWLIKNEIENKDGILTIVNSDLEPDARNDAIKRKYPKQYKWLLENVYPTLRHSDYTVKYLIKTYIDIEALKRAYKNSPERLRPIDFQRVADTYTPHTPEWAEVILKAVEYYPKDQMANLNAANIMMERNQLTEAASYMDKAGDSREAIYTRGVLAARQGDLKRAKQLLEMASEQGMKQAQAELLTLNEMLNRPKVKLFIETGARKK